MEAKVCQRCNDAEAIILSRKELFCSGCFKSFISLKQRKIMMLDEYYQTIFKVLHKDKFRTEEEANDLNKNSKVLVPFNFESSSSLVMLDILIDTLNEQRVQHHGNTGFKVELLITFQDKDDFSLIKENLSNLINNRYAENKGNIKVHFVNLSEFYNTSFELKELLLQEVDFKIFKDSVEHESYDFETLLNQCPNRSIREDIMSFVTKHLIKKYAYQNLFKSILWSHSMTRLADEIIALIVKGRGSNIATFLNMESFDENYGNNVFKNLYPMKNILLSEIDAYCYTVGLSQYLIKYQVQDTLLIKKLYDSENKRGNENVLIRNMTMNELASKYFDDIEGDYSNVISTVLRTGEKIGIPESKGTEKRKCEICLQSIYNDPSLWLNTITETLGHPIENETEEAYLETWKKHSTTAEQQSRSRKLMALKENKDASANICYGCLVLLNSVKERTIIWKKHDDDELNEVLQEFVLSENE